VGLLGTQQRPDNIILGSLDDLINLSRSRSLWPLTFGIACCAIEMMNSSATRYDMDRFGVFYRNTPRQADVMIVSGTVNKKMGKRVRILWEQMSEPKWVISMGACANQGGPFRQGYSVVEGVDKIVPRPEALMQALLLLRDKVADPKARYVPGTLMNADFDPLAEPGQDGRVHL
jgi:NADH-quinone oxidoreductase subunit B